MLAAQCSMCRSTVYVTADGRCPNGHGPEALSGYYEAPDPPAPTQAPPQPAPRRQRSSAKIALIALAIIAALTLVGVASCCAFGNLLLTEGETDVDLPEDDTSDAGRGAYEPTEADEIAYELAVYELEADLESVVDVWTSSYPAQTDADADACAAAFDELQAVQQSAMELEVPVKYMAIHDYFLEAIALLFEAGELMEADDYREASPERMEQIAELFIEAGGELLQMSDAVDALGEVWGP